MSVTAPVGSARNDASRNALLLSAAKAEGERRINDPQREFIERIFGTKTNRDVMVDAARWFFSHSSYLCDGPGGFERSTCQHVFEAGEVVHRRRMRIGYQPGSIWRLESFCVECVSKWHPSWLAHRQWPVPCAGGCGALVSHWQPWKWITTCSTRCTELAARERRLVRHDERRCEVCDEPFTPKRSDARYCSNACRQDAYRQRRAGRL